MQLRSPTNLFASRADSNRERRDAGHRNEREPLVALELVLDGSETNVGEPRTEQGQQVEVAEVPTPQEQVQRDEAENGQERSLSTGDILSYQFLIPW